MGDAQPPSGPLNSTQVNHTHTYTHSHQNTHRETHQHTETTPQSKNMYISGRSSVESWKAVCADFLAAGALFYLFYIFFLSKYSWLCNTIFSFLELMMSSEMANVCQHLGRKMKCCHLSTEGKCFPPQREGRARIEIMVITSVMGDYLRCTYLRISRRAYTKGNRSEGERIIHFSEDTEE